MSLNQAAAAAARVEEEDEERNLVQVDKVCDLCLAS
jgi:hypothetical protein